MSCVSLLALHVAKRNERGGSLPDARFAEIVAESCLVVAELKQTQFDFLLLLSLGLSDSNRAHSNSKRKT